MVEKAAKVWLGGRTGVTPPIHVSQYDTGWRFLLSVYDGDAVYTGGDGTAVYLEGKKADQTVFAVPGTFADGVAVVDCTASITAAVGPIDCELRVSEDGETVGTANFEIVVEAAPLKGYVASGDDFSAMQQVLDGANQAAGSALASKAAAAASASAAAVSAATAQVQAGMAYKMAPTAADMTDHSIGYLYTGSEPGYTFGGWYYWDGSAWVLGGMSVDPTLTVSGAAADAATVGTALYGTKTRKDANNKNINIAAKLTYWDAANEGFSADNKATPADMYINSYVQISGSWLDANAWCPEIETNKTYEIWCWANLHNSVSRFYIVKNYGSAMMYTGSTSNSGATVVWRRAYTPIDSALNTPDAAADAAVTGERIKGAFDTAVNPTQFITIPAPQASDGVWPLREDGIVASSGLPMGGESSVAKYRRVMQGEILFKIPYSKFIIYLGRKEYEWTAWSYTGATWATASRNLTRQTVYVSAVEPIVYEYQDNDARFCLSLRRADGADWTAEDTAIINANLKFLRAASGSDTRILFLGDSVPRGRVGDGNTLTQFPIPNHIAENLGITCENFSIGNIGWNAGYADGNNKTNAIGYLKRVGDPDYYDWNDSAFGYKFLGTGDWGDFNTIVFALGGNDLNYPVGSVEDLDDSLSYADVMAWRTSAYINDPNCTIVKAVYQAVRWIRESEDNHVEGEPFVPGGKFKQIVICDSSTGARTMFKRELCAMYAQFCERYGVAHVSAYDAPIDPLHLTDYLPDSVHPNAETYNLLGRYLSAKISGLTGQPISAEAAAEIQAGELVGEDLLRRIGSFDTVTSNGITFTWSGGSCAVTGTREANQAICPIYDRRTALPEGMRPGDRFLLRYKDSLNSSILQWYIFFWNTAGKTWDFSTNTWSDAQSAHLQKNLTWPVIVPEGANGLTVQLRVSAGSADINAAVNYCQLVKMPQREMEMPLLVSFVDDDTSGYEYVRKYREACRHNGVYGNYAVLTKYSEDDYAGSGWTGPEMRQRLLDYEDEGFGMLIHLWRQSSADPWLSTGTDEEKIAQCRAVLLKGLREMREFGFANYNYWVTPYGVRGENFRRIAREAGVECLISTNNERHNSMQDYQADFIKRVALRHDDTRPDGIKNAMADVKAAIDAAAADGKGWLIITTHFNEWGGVTWDSSLDANGFEVGYARFNEMVQYAVAAGLTPVTLPRAWSYYKPILEANLDVINSLPSEKEIS